MCHPFLSGPRRWDVAQITAAWVGLPHSQLRYPSACCLFAFDPVHFFCCLAHCFPLTFPSPLCLILLFYIRRPKIITLRRGGYNLGLVPLVWSIHSGVCRFAIFTMISVEIWWIPRVGVGLEQLVSEQFPRFKPTKVNFRGAILLVQTP